MAKREKITTDATPLSCNPFAGLGQQLGDLPPGDPVMAEAKSAARSDGPATDPATDPTARLVVRRQKKGQGGKTATFIEGLGGGDLDGMLDDLKRQLGCSGRVQGTAVVVGTSEHARVAEWLRERGFTRVVLGN